MEQLTYCRFVACSDHKFRNSYNRLFNKLSIETRVHVEDSDLVTSFNKEVIINKENGASHEVSEGGKRYSTIVEKRMCRRNSYGRECE